MADGIENSSVRLCPLICANNNNATQHNTKRRVQGETVLCYHRNLLYKAKVMQVAEDQGKIVYKVHYIGWKKNWDEWVDDERIEELDEQGLQKKKELESQHCKGGQPVHFRRAAATLLPPLKKRTLTPKSSTPTPHVKQVVRSTKLSADRESVSCSSTTPSKNPIFKHQSGSKPSSEGPLQEKMSLQIKVSIQLPESLKLVLLNDWKRINRQMMLTQLPAEKNIDTILNEYFEAEVAQCEDCRDTILEMITGLQNCFNAMLSEQLLYKLEVIQYGEVHGSLIELCSHLLKDQKGEQLTTLYGFVHLLRLFVKVGSMLTCAALSERCKSVLLKHMQNFLTWMAQNQEKLFNLRSVTMLPPLTMTTKFSCNELSSYHCCSQLSWLQLSVMQFLSVSHP